MLLWLAVGLFLWLLSVGFLLCLCRVAARADKNYTPPSPILRYGALSRRRAIRAARRAGYAIDSQGRERLGMD